MMRKIMLSPIVEKRLSKRSAAADTNAATNQKVFAGELPYATTTDKSDQCIGGDAPASVHHELYDAEATDFGDFSVALSSDDEGRILPFMAGGGGDNIDSSFRSKLSSDEDSYVKEKDKGGPSMMVFAKGKVGLLDSSSVHSNISSGDESDFEVHLPLKLGSEGGILYGLPDCSIRCKVDLSKLDVSARSTGLESIESPLDSSMDHLNIKNSHCGHYQKVGIKERGFDSSYRSTLSSDDSTSEKIYTTFTSKKIGGSLDVSARSAISVESMYNGGSVDDSIRTSPHDSGLLCGLPECSIRGKVEELKIDFSIRSTRSCGGESVESTFNPDSERYVPIHPPAVRHRTK